MYINSTWLNMILVMMTIKFLAVNRNMNAVQLLYELEDFENNIKNNYCKYDTYVDYNK